MAPSWAPSSSQHHREAQAQDGQVLKKHNILSQQAAAKPATKGSGPSAHTSSCLQTHVRTKLGSRHSFTQLLTCSPEAGTLVLLITSLRIGSGGKAVQIREMNQREPLQRIWITPRHLSAYSRTMWRQEPVDDDVDLRRDTESFWNTPTRSRKRQDTRLLVTAVEEAPPWSPRIRRRRVGMTVGSFGEQRIRLGRLRHLGTFRQWVPSSVDWWGSPAWCTRSVRLSARLGSEAVAHIWGEGVSGVDGFGG